ncbi:MAG: pyruvate dehydrogenase (acetyl-transferring) E1 component subunit alpha [Desulfobacterales bacterium]|jgi:pyruvate dehydrogenase E1 component alpha subunit|nr:pyruvate dehydrogenase (acetyl-transferring) E1 component subunit alpha [Desulfobacterales bacterium]
MPRTPVPFPCQIEHLSILDENGGLDAALEPRIDPAELLRLHRAMLLGRRFDERMLGLQRQGRIGTFAPITGQEAAQLGAVAALRASDWMVPSFRETAAEIWRGKPMENFIIFFGGFNEGGRIAPESNDLPLSVPVGSQVPHAVGLAWAMKYRGSDQVAMTFFGDGATSEGDFHEGLNLAAVFQVPVIFVCQNNQWAISIPRTRQTRSETLAQKAIAYGMPGIQVDGNDILAVYAAAREAVARARAGGGPTLIECVTYRLSMHTTADDPKRYRSDEDVAVWKKRDPIPRFQRYLTEKGLLSPEKIETLEAEIKAEIQAAVDRAEQQMAQMGDPLEMFDHVYAEMTPDLQAQKAELAQELAAARSEKEGSDG